MSHSVCCFPQTGKEKSRLILEAFAAGCGGRLADRYELRPGPAAFYGVVGLEDLWSAASARGEYFYLDNAFLDAARGTHFRVGKNQLQGPVGAPDFGRLNALGVEIQPWRRDGRHIVVAAQSEHFMAHVAGWRGGAVGWQEEVLRRLKMHTNRPIVLRHWARDKTEAARTLKQHLDGAWAIVVHTSAAANEALLAGVPAFCTGPCAALPMGLSQLEQIENPRRPDGRHEWAASLAAAQWTLDEFRNGAAWRALNG